MRRLAGVYENGFEVSIRPMQRVSFLKLGSPELGSMGSGDERKEKQQGPEKCIQNLCVHRYAILRLWPLQIFYSLRLNWFNSLSLAQGAMESQFRKLTH